MQVAKQGLNTISRLNKSVLARIVIFNINESNKIKVSDHAHRNINFQTLVIAALPISHLPHSRSLQRNASRVVCQRSVDCVCRIVRNFRAHEATCWLAVIADDNYCTGCSRAAFPILQLDTEVTPFLRVISVAAAPYGENLSLFQCAAFRKDVHTEGQKTRPGELFVALSLHTTWFSIIPLDGAAHTRVWMHGRIFWLFVRRRLEPCANWRRQRFNLPPHNFIFALARFEASAAGEISSYGNCEKFIAMATYAT